MRFLLAIIVFILPQVLLCKENSHEYPVKWTEYIYLDFISEKVKKLSDFERSLDVVWSDNQYLLVNTHSNEQVIINNCRSLLQNDAISRFHVGNRTIERIWRLHCTAMKMVSGMTNSQNNHLDEITPDLIRELVGIDIPSDSPEYKNYFFALRDSEYTFPKCDGDFCHIVSPVYTYVLKKLAQGDINNDGVQDVILIVYSRFEGGDVLGDSWLGLVLTRRDAKSKLELIKFF